MWILRTINKGQGVVILFISLQYNKDNKKTASLPSWLLDMVGSEGFEPST